MVVLGMIAASASALVAYHFVGSADDGSEIDALAGPELCGLESGIWFNAKEPLEWRRLAGRPVVLEFWASWCPNCLKHIRHVNALQRRFADRGLVVIGVTEDDAATAFAFSRKYDIEYAVCAGQRAKGIDVLPTTLLVNGRGRVVHRTSGAGDHSKLVEKLKRLPVLSAPDVLQKGALHGFVDARPASARGFDVAALAIEMDDYVLPRIEAGKPLDMPAEIRRLFEFYHRNMPTPSWAGDACCRDDVFRYVFYLRDRLAHHGLQEGSEQLRTELRKLCEAPDPKWTIRSALAMAAGKTLPSEPGTIKLLSDWLESEKNPVVCFRLERSLEWLDPTRKRLEPAVSLLKQAQAEHGTAKQKRTLLPEDLREYEEYVADIDAVFDASEPDELIRRFERDYDTYRESTRRGVLIRYFILDGCVSVLFAQRPLSREDRCRLERWLYSLFTTEEPDWSLRLTIWLTFHQIAIDSNSECLERSKILSAVEDRIRREPVRDVRAYIELGRMELLGIDKDSSE